LTLSFDFKELDLGLLINEVFLNHRAGRCADGKVVERCCETLAEAAVERPKRPVERAASGFGEKKYFCSPRC
jgi:hypothetical protein